MTKKKCHPTSTLLNCKCVILLFASHFKEIGKDWNRKHNWIVEKLSLFHDRYCPLEIEQNVSLIYMCKPNKEMCGPGFHWSAMFIFASYGQLDWKFEGISPVIISRGLSAHKRKIVGVICMCRLLLLLFYQSVDVSFWKEDWHCVILVCQMISSHSSNYIPGVLQSGPRLTSP